MNPTLLFTRLSALAGRSENVEEYFHYELTSNPMSIFKSTFMRKPDKASLWSVILTKEKPTPSHSVKVIDGGSLLHQVDWSTSVTYADLLSQYFASVRKKFGDCIVIFDGYDTPSVKDHEHIRRSSGNKCKEIHFTKDMRVTSKREKFLSNNKNKTLLISVLQTELENDSQQVIVAQGDADALIVKEALQVYYMTNYL